MNNKEFGYIGENIACMYLKKEGYNILERNYYTKFGELDIIAFYKDTIIFVEVKSRRNEKYGRPCEAVTSHKLNHIINSAKRYYYINHLDNLKVRFDVIEVYYTKSKWIINHIKDIY